MKFIAGFDIDTYDEDYIECNARDENIELTKEIWEQLNRDIQQLETNVMAYCRKQFNIYMRDEGHDSSGVLLGSCWGEDDSKIKNCTEEDNGLQSHEMNESVYNHISEIGKKILDIRINFFDIKKDK